MFTSHDILQPSDLNPEGGIILYTYGCNLKCPFCFVPQLVTGPRKMKLGESIVDAILKKHSDQEWIIISGGEPTIHNERLPEKLKEFRDSGFKTEVCTNGTTTMIRDHDFLQNVDFLRIDFKGFNNGILSEVQVEQVLENIIWLRSCEDCPELEVRCTIHESTMDLTELEMFLEEMKGIGVKRVGITKAISTVDTIGGVGEYNKSYADELIEKYKDSFDIFKVYREGE